MKLENALDTLLKDIERIKEIKLPELDCTHTWRLWLSLGELAIELHIPYDLAILRKFRHELGKDWQAEGGLKEISSLVKYQVYIHKNGTRLDVDLNVNVKGSTCRRVETGSKTIKTYEIVCD